jgi:AcrR family transcriptional regulator
MQRKKDMVTDKAEQMRSRILEIALDMFCERGYDETTMRAIAEDAGVALGNTYYYFRSKDQLIQAFYERIHQETFAACRPVLDKERTLDARLRGVMRSMLGVIEPYHHLSGLLFKTAADTHSPLNPFSSESEAVREQSITLFKEVVRGSRPSYLPCSGFTTWASYCSGFTMPHRDTRVQTASSIKRLSW